MTLRGRLPTIPDVPPRAANCHLGGGCGGAPASTTAAHLEKARNHPCYSEEAHHHFARMHVAVAPACNIRCNYCNRKYDCANENRPGVVSERLSPDEALRKIVAVAAEVPQLSVVGIAGPGDPLANPERTFRTIDLVKRAFPDVKLCVSTNGLALPDCADRLVDSGVEHVTVTVNMIDADVGARIHPWIALAGHRIGGRDGARTLSERQLEGIARLTARGALVKVNSVLIPGVNDAHLPEVSRRVRALGAFVHNVMPLIAAPEHGTRYGLTGQRGPTREELEAVQTACAADVKVMRHCRQCRADAVGLLGQDRCQEFTLDHLRDGGNDGAEARRAHRAVVERQRSVDAAARDAALAAIAAGPVAGAPDLSARIAVATRGGGAVNQHFGHATEFQVYDVERGGARFVGVRTVEHYCVGGEGEDGTLESILRAVSDCTAVLVAKIGRCPRERLAQAGIEPVDGHAFESIEAAALGWFGGYAARVARGEVVHVPRSERGADAALRGVA